MNLEEQISEVEKQLDLILSGSVAGTSSNLSAASSSGLFVFSGGTTALAGGTDTIFYTRT